VRTIGVGERRARLARRHLLLPADRTDDLPALAEALVALHSSDPATVYLSALARMRTPSLEAVATALYDDRSLVRHHAVRRTLWVTTPQTARLLHAAATRRLVGPERRRTAKLLAVNGVEDPEGWLDQAAATTVATLDEHGPLTARDLGRLVPDLRQEIVMAPGKPYSATVSAHTRVLLALGFEGRVLRGRPTGTWVNGAYRYAAAHAWVDGGVEPGPDVLTEREAARELALRWLQRFGPATTTDLQWWTGWTGALTRQALVDSGAVEVLVEGPGAGPAWVAPGDEEPVPEPDVPWVAVLPGLDPTTMGWKERGWYLPEPCAAVFDRMGNAGPTLWADGRVVGGWVQRRDGELRTRLLEEVPDAVRRALAERTEEVARWVGETRFTVRFPSPVSAALFAD